MGCLKLTYYDQGNALEVNSNFFGEALEKKGYSDFFRLKAYTYGFNGQERDDEVSGSGNSYTAEFWQYDSRLGRRWNLDPRPVTSISQYAAFQNNPIMYSDPHGDSIKSKISSSLRKEMGISKKEAKSYTPEKVANSFRQEYGIEVETRNGYLHYNGESESQPDNVSQSAKAMWTEILGDYKTKNSLLFDFNSKSIQEGLAIGNVAKIDLGDFNSDLSVIGVNYNNVPTRAYNLGRIMEHEFLGHNYKKLYDDNGSSPYDPKIHPGETVDFVNTFRSQMGLPIRSAYGDKFQWTIPFEFKNGDKSMIKFD